MAQTAEPAPAVVANQRMDKVTPMYAIWDRINISKGLKYLVLQARSTHGKAGQFVGCLNFRGHVFEHCTE